MKKMPGALLLIVLLCLPFSIVSGALAAPPDAGSILNEQRQIGSSLPDRLPSQETTTEQVSETDSKIRVTVKQFRFTGLGTMATGAEMQDLVRDYIGQELGFNQLQAIAAKITNYLRDKKGYLLARAYLPKQDVTAGIIEITIIPGKIDGAVRINRKQPSRISQALLEGTANKAIPMDEAIQLAQLERATLLMNDLPGVTARTSLAPGSSSGTTRVTIETTEGPLLSGAISSDNYGDHYTGTWRGNGQLSANDPFGWGDQLSLSLTGAEHMFQGRATYSLPLGSSGLSGSLAYTNLHYELGKELSGLDAKGCANTVGATLAYPLMRSRSSSVWAKLGFEYQKLIDEASSSRIKERELNIGNAALTGSFFDNFGGGGLTSAAINIISGDLDLSGVNIAQQADATGPETDGNFVRCTYSLARLQRLTKSVSLFGSIRGQLASCNLDSSQKFILGGPTGVRAYPVGEASGDEGHAFTVETRYDVPKLPSWATTQLVGFIDSGWIKLHNDVWDGAITNISGKNNYWLSGGGIGVNTGKIGLYSVRAVWAHTIDTNKGRSTTGRDADNRNDDNRFWLQAVVWF